MELTLRHELKIKELDLRKKVEDSGSIFSREIKIENTKESFENILRKMFSNLDISPHLELMNVMTNKKRG